MRINLLVSGLAVSGGIRVVLEYANRLTDRGHRVTVVAPVTLADEAHAGSLRQRAARWGRWWLAERRVGWFPVRAGLRVAPSLEERHVPDADVTIATHWRTAEALGRYGRRPGRPIYFVQGYEIWAGPRERVEATYRAPSVKLAVSSWLRRLLRERFGQEAIGPMVSGVDFEQFRNDAKVFNDPPRIGMIYRDTTWRGTADGLRAFALVRDKRPDARLVMFGQGWPWVEAPPDTEYHRDPPQSALAGIYGGCDVWINPSWHEGLPLPPMEAMACRCAVVTTDVGVEDYVVPGTTALVVPPRDPDALARAVLELLDDPARLRAVSEAGYRHIRRFTWEDAAQRFERALAQAVAS